MFCYSTMNVYACTRYLLSSYPGYVCIPAFVYAIAPPGYVMVYYDDAV